MLVSTNTKRILIADDEKQTTYCLSMILRMRGYEAITADNGRDALYSIVEMQHSGTPIDLLICDIRMPGLSGEALISKLHELKLQIPTLVMTAFGEKNLVVRLMRLGCRDFIDKPFEPAEIRERVENLLAQTGEELLEARRKDQLAIVGEVAHSLVHDMNNMLTGAVGYAELAIEEVDPAHPVSEKLHKLLVGASIGAETCRKLLALRNGNRAVVKAPTDVGSVVERIAVILRSIAPQSVEVRTNLPGKQVWLKADAACIQQALLNLGINALDAMPCGGQLTLSLCCGRRPGGSPVTRPDCISVSVTDTGCGVLPGNLPKLFEEGFTTKQKGNGYGLARVKKIVEEHNGWIDVESEPMKGSNFILNLPATD